MPINTLVLSFCTVLISQAVQAQALFMPGLSTRSRAMGGTSIAFARGVDALYYNPAALSLVEGYSFKIMDANVGVSTNSKRLLDQMDNQGGPLNSGQLNDLYGKTFFAEVSAFGGMVIPNFGVGAYTSNYVTEVFNNPVYPTFNVDFISDYGYTIAGAIPLGENVSLGVGGRHIVRWGGQKDLLVADLIGRTDRELIEQEFSDKGKGNALDLSMLILIPSSDLSLAAVWKDVGGTTFRPISGDGPSMQEDVLTFGAALQKETSIGDFIYALDYNFVRQSGGLVKKLHAGTEWSLGLIDLRAGLSQGYLTYGAGLDFSVIKFEAAFYSDEVGRSVGDNRNDRYQASIILQLDFDQAFKLSDSAGKKRRLMKRR